MEPTFGNRKKKNKNVFYDVFEQRTFLVNKIGLREFTQVYFTNRKTLFSHEIMTQKNFSLSVL